MIDATDLARRLVDSPKGITPERLKKLAVHIKSAQHLEAVLAAIPDHLRDQVRAGLAPLVRR